MGLEGGGLRFLPINKINYLQKKTYLINYDITYMQATS